MQEAGCQAQLPLSADRSPALVDSLIMCMISHRAISMLPSDENNITSDLSLSRRTHQSTGAPGVPTRRGRRAYRALQWLPNYAWQRLIRRLPSGVVHLVFVLADHFEPGIVPQDRFARAPYDEQQRRLGYWCREYPRLVDPWRDNEGHPFCHTYFYPAEQYDKALIERLANHCHAGWGEIEIHLHHGTQQPDTTENTYRQLVEFRDTLSSRHGCLSYLDNSGTPRYAFVHGNFALANSTQGRGCGVDSEMQVLADTGCYADLTLPAAALHPAQTGKINSLYECALPLNRRAPQRRGRDLQRGRPPRVFPLIVQGPLMLDFAPLRPSRGVGIENGALTAPNPPTLSRLRLWKQARLSVQGRPDWLFIKLHCHSMDPTQETAVLGLPMQQFLRELVEGAQERKEILHFVSAREMVNIILAACDGREGNPGEYRDYRLKRLREPSSKSPSQASQVVPKG